MNKETDPPAAKRRLATILAIDMAGYSARAEADQEEAARAVAALDARARAVADKYQGRVFSTAGDGFMLEFSSASDALHAAADLLAHPDPVIRIGAHVGEVVVTANEDLLGHAVNVAARLQREAADGTALVSRAVRDLIHGPFAKRLHAVGKLDLPKIDQGVEAFCLDPEAVEGRAPRRRRRIRIAFTLAAIAAGLALFSMVWNSGLLGNRDAMVRAALSDPEAVRAITAQVTTRLVADAQAGRLESQENLDGAYNAILDLSQSAAAPEQAAFSFLRQGETSRAVDALERFAAELEGDGRVEEASAAYARAGALATFLDKPRALTNLRRAFALSPNRLQRFADLMQATASAEGYQAAFRFAEQTLARTPAPPPEIFVYARYAGSILAGDLNETALQRSLIEEARPRLAALRDDYLVALDRVARGYLNLQEGDLMAARALYQDGRRRLSALPQHARDHQQGWLLTLLAAGDFDTAWRDGRAFVAEREQAGAAPVPFILFNTCIAGLTLDEPAAAAAPYCQAAARGLVNSLGEPSAGYALALLSAARGDLPGARAQLAAAQRSPWYPALPANRVYAGRVEAEIAGRASDYDTMIRALDETRAAIDASPALAPRKPIFLGFLELTHARWALEMNRKDEACEALDRAAASYRVVGGEAGARFAQSRRRAARC